ncbi:hypothetical protein, partial [Saccharopolyspora shandongensis]|uniref:hypothetical protein n=1 Tax=Saccharopolyspora shandongensis TaxID=418495 RepID=UPI0033C9347A
MLGLTVTKTQDTGGVPPFGPPGRRPTPRFGRFRAKSPEGGRHAPGGEVLQAHDETGRRAASGGA